MTFTEQEHLAIGRVAIVIPIYNHEGKAAEVIGKAGNWVGRYSW